MRVLGIAVLATVLAACSGGGGGGGSGQTFANPGTDLRTIQLGDQLTYALKVTDDEGTERGEYELTYVNGPNYTTPNRQLQTIREQAVQSAGGTVFSTTTTDYYQDLNNSIFLIADEDAVINGTNFDAGSYPLETQSPIGVGSSWSFDKTFVVSASVSQRRTLNASVTSREMVSTPFGRFEAYKIVFSETCEGSQIYTPCDVRSSQGTVWVYPPLGRVKGSFRQTDFVGFDSDIEYELTDTNIPVQ